MDDKSGEIKIVKTLPNGLLKKLNRTQKNKAMERYSIALIN